MGAVFGPNPVLLAHRGSGSGTVGGLVENTLPSFLAAADAGAPWLEVDVRRSGDGQLFVMHNPAYPDGTFLTDVTGAQAAERGTLRLGELLAALPGGVGVDFDLKTSMEDAVTEPDRTTASLLAEVAAGTGAARPVLVTSFDPAALTLVRARAPEVALGLLTWLNFPMGHAVAAIGHLDADVLAVHYGSLSPSRLEPAAQQRPLAHVVDLVHRAGRELVAWTAPADRAPELIGAGVDGVCVNDVAAVARGLADAAAVAGGLAGRDRDEAPGGGL